MRNSRLPTEKPINGPIVASPLYIQKNRINRQREILFTIERRLPTDRCQVGLRPGTLPRAPRPIALPEPLDLPSHFGTVGIRPDVVPADSKVPLIWRLPKEGIGLHDV